MAETKSIYKKLSKVQKELKAPKGQWNTYGKYNYRSAEDILEAVKPLLVENELMLIMSDKPKMMENSWVYIEATVLLLNLENTEERLEVSAYAREAETKKGMDLSQITGSASSYARKYALNGLFAIDDTKDSDTDEQRNQIEATPVEPSENDPMGQKDILFIMERAIELHGEENGLECIKEMLKSLELKGTQDLKVKHNLEAREFVEAWEK